MPKEDTDSLPPMARLYDVMQQRGKSIYARRSSNHMTGSAESKGPSEARRPATSVPRSSSTQQIRVRRTRSTTGPQSTKTLRNHPGDVADPDDCELFGNSQADVPPPPLVLQERKYTRSPLMDGSFASTADL
jgi:hypothetical protein